LFLAGSVGFISLPKLKFGRYYSLVFFIKILDVTSERAIFDFGNGAGTDNLELYYKAN
jgi:hypothetical protein